MKSWDRCAPTRTRCVTTGRLEGSELVEPSYRNVRPTVVRRLSITTFAERFRMRQPTESRQLTIGHRNSRWTT